jgi:hypothetical protein
MTKPIDDCIHWIREREAVRAKKDAGFPFPWTKDEIIGTYRFCNVRREDDKVTVWIRKNIRVPFAQNQYLWFMLCAARQINWPDTLGVLIGCPEYWPIENDGYRFDPIMMGKALQDVADAGGKVFTGAYNITAPPVKGMKKTTWVAEHTLGELWRNRAHIGGLWAERQPSMKYVHSQIMKYDCWGPFMAYQAVVDMRFTSLLSGARDVKDWAAAGPGTIRGLNRLADRRLDAHLKQDQACLEMNRLWPLLMKESGVKMDFSDVPNVMCETDKYLRVKNGQGKPRATYVPGRGS